MIFQILSHPCFQIWNGWQHYNWNMTINFDFCFVIVMANEWYISVQWFLLLFRCGGNWVLIWSLASGGKNWLWNTLVCLGVEKKKREKGWIEWNESVIQNEIKWKGIWCFLWVLRELIKRNGREKINHNYAVIHLK